MISFVERVQLSALFCYRNIGEYMDIIYKKNTLYVYLDESLNDSTLEILERRVNNILRTYKIDNLVINSEEENDEHLHKFECKYNSTHRSKVIIK